MGVKSDIRFRSSVVAAILAFAVAAPAWSDTLVLRDGSRLTGTMTSADVNSITFTDRRGQPHNYAVRDVDSVQFGDAPGDSGRNQSDRDQNYPPPDYSANQNNGPGPYDNRSNPNYPNDRGGYDQQQMERTVLPQGTVIVIRTNERIDNRNAAEGQTYSAQIDQDIRDSDGMVAIPRGSDARLVTRRIDNDGDITLDIESVVVQGRRYRVSTTDQKLEGTQQDSIGKNERTGRFVGGGAILGAIVGAVAGGGKGAAIGAAAGAGAGAGAEVLTSGKEVHVPAETVLRFRLDHALHLHLWS